MDQPIFIRHELEFEKQAAIARIGDDPEKWGKQVTTELYRNLPFLHKYSVEVRIDRVDPERGYGLGAAIVKNRSFRNPVETLQGGSINYSRIPIIIKGMYLQPVDVFLVGRKILPLTEERFSEAMFRPEIFDATKQMPASPSLVSSLFPPVYGRQGHEGGGLFEMGYSSKLGAVEEPHAMPILSQVTQTIRRADLERVEEALSDPAVGHAVRSNPFFKQAAAAICAADVWTEEDADLREAALIANIPPVVCQLSKTASGHVMVKEANPEVFLPKSEVMSPQQAQEIAGADIISRLETDGTITLTTDPVARTDSTLERVEAVTDFGEYRVKDLVGHQLLGWVFPSVFNFNMVQLPMMLFTNGSVTAMQENIVGSRVGQGTNLPSKVPAAGDYGSFTFAVKGRAAASIPLHITAVGEDGKLYAKSELGGEFCFTYSPGLKIPVQGESPSDTMEYYAIPESYEFMPLSTEFLELQEDSEMFHKVSAVADYATGVINVAYDRTGTVTMAGYPIQNVEEGLRCNVNQDEAEFLLVTAGVHPTVAREKLAAAKLYGGVEVTAHRLVVPYYMQKAAATYKAAKLVMDLPKIPKHIDIIKVAAAVSDSATVDSLLGLNFATPENVMLLGEMRPQFEATQSRIAELLLSARLGVSQLPEGALEKAMFYLEEVLKALHALSGGFKNPTAMAPGI